MKFRLPKEPIGDGNTPVDRAAMPEATVYKHGKTFGWKDEIGISKCLAPAAPARDCMRTEDINQAQFRGFIVPALDARHNFGPFSNRKHVGHSMILSRDRTFV
jgi:hypothetical protein